MSDARIAAVASALLLLAASPTYTTHADEGGTEFKGYYKNLLISSRTTFPLTENFTLDLNRLRLEARGHPRDWFGFDIQYDNEAFLGSYLDTAQFQQMRAAPPPTYWDLEDDYVNRGSIFVRHRLYRGYVDFATPVADVLIGRQRIAWGSGHFWNPTDLLNPFNPTAIEPEERQGVDVLLVQRNIGALSRLSLAYAPQRDAPDSRAIHYRTNVADTDVAVLLGQFRGDRVVGMDVVGRVGEGGLRAEVAHTRAENGADFTRLVAGLDYAFANTLILSVEYYYNGQGSTNEAAYDLLGLQAGLIQNVARHYWGAQAIYDLTPLLRTDNALIVNADDGSRFFAPRLIYSIASNLDGALGIQLFGGHSGSEYASFNNVYFAYVQWFF
jgi:opacity protein-like surface antigen